MLYPIMPVGNLAQFNGNHLLSGHQISTSNALEKARCDSKVFHPAMAHAYCNDNNFNSTDFKGMPVISNRVVSLYSNIFLRVLHQLILSVLIRL